MRLLLLPATYADADELRCFMRKSDVDEVRFCAERLGRVGPGWSIGREIREAMAAQDVWAIRAGGDLVGLGGIAPDPANPQRGAIWFLGTDLADRYPHGLTRICRRFIAVFGPDFPDGIGNIIPGHMPRRVAWMQRLGFDIQPIQAQHCLQGFVIAWMASPLRP